MTLTRTIPRFLSPEWAGHPLVRSLLDAVTDDDLNAMSDDELEAIETAAATVLAAARQRRDRQQRSVTRSWAASCPGWDRRSQQSTLSWHLQDHGYRMRETDGYRIWVGEPYDLTSEDLVELVRLAEDGWHIHLDGRGRWYPGSTLRILYWRREERPAFSGGID